MLYRPSASTRNSMPSPQSRQYEQFQAHPNGFRWRGADFNFNQIRHIFFSAMRDAEDGTDAATLVITVDSGSKIPLGFEGVTSYFARHIANLKHLHAFLSYQSFSHRVERYLEELKAHGYFTYDNCRFYPRRSIVCGSKE